MRIGVVGTGHLGNIHLKCLKQTAFQTVGVFDLDQSKAEKAAQQHQVTAFTNLEDLLDQVDATIVVSDTKSHFEVAKQSLEKNLHTFIEKPITSSVQEAEALKSIMDGRPDLKVQVGHVERFNPAFVTALESVNNPMFIECHRLANFNPRGNDVSVILDLMIHDLDILLAVVEAEISEIRANGVEIVSNTADICNARIEFSNGCVANLTASRLSLKQMRKFRIFQGDAYIGIDFLDKSCQIVQLNEQDAGSGMKIETDKGVKYLDVKSQKAQESNAIVEELNEFYQSIVQKSNPRVGIDHALKVMKAAYLIEDKLKPTYA